MPMQTKCLLMAGGKRLPGYSNTIQSQLKSSTKMDTSSFIIAAIFLTVVFFGDKILAWLSYNFYDLQVPVKEEYPIQFPYEPFFENYISIIEEIERCDDLKSLNTAYVRILIFEGCYANTGCYVSELIEAYQKKEKEISQLS